LILFLGIEIAKPEIIKAIMKEFIRRGLDKVYSKEIEEWKKYKREEIYTKDLDKEMEDEMELFKENIKGWTPKELEEIIWDIDPNILK